MVFRLRITVTTHLRMLDEVTTNANSHFCYDNEMNCDMILMLIGHFTKRLNHLGPAMKLFASYAAQVKDSCAIVMDIVVPRQTIWSGRAFVELL